MATNDITFKPLQLDKTEREFRPIQNKGKADRQDAKLQKAAQDFEAIFVSEILKKMRRSVSESGLFGGGVAGDIYTSMFDDTIAQSIARKNGLHLADIIIKEFQGSENKTQADQALDLNDYRLRPIQVLRPAKKIEADAGDDAVKKSSAGEWDRSVIQRAAEHHGVDPRLVEAIIKAESNYRPDVVSNKGAAGLMQLMKETADELGVKNRFNPEENVFGGVKYFKSLLDHFGDVELALGAYNAGPTAVTRHNGIPPYKETQNYVKKVMEFYREL
jgi:Rod binding domain-containing protein